MAKQCMVRREIKRERLVKNAAARRAELTKALKDPNVEFEEKFVILHKLEKMGRDSSKVRLTRRCRETGRAHGVYRKTELCRHKFREFAQKGFLPGVVMSSW